VPFLDYFQKVSPFRIRQRGNFQCLQVVIITCLLTAQGHLIGEPGASDIEAAVSFPTGLVGERTGDEGFPGAHSRVINIKGHSYRLKEHAFSKQLRPKQGEDMVTTSPL